MSLKLMRDGVPVHIAGGGEGGEEGIVIDYETYKNLADKTGLYYVTGDSVADGDLSGSTVTFSGEGEIPVLPTVTATSPAKIEKTETFSSLISKITEVITNVRWLFGHLGDIRKVTGGTVVESGVSTTYSQVGLTVTDAIANLNTKLVWKKIASLTTANQAISIDLLNYNEVMIDGYIASGATVANAVLDIKDSDNLGVTKQISADGTKYIANLVFRANNITLEYITGFQKVVIKAR